MGGTGCGGRGGRGKETGCVVGKGMWEGWGDEEMQGERFGARGGCGERWGHGGVRKDTRGKCGVTWGWRRPRGGRGVWGSPVLTTAPGSRRSWADSPRLSASRRYSPGSCLHFSLLELSDPASAQGHSTYGSHHVTAASPDTPQTPDPHPRGVSAAHPPPAGCSRSSF